MTIINRYYKACYDYRNEAPLTAEQRENLFSTDEETNYYILHRGIKRSIRYILEDNQIEACLSEIK